MKHIISLKTLVTFSIIISSVTLIKSQSFTENFDDITALAGNGWYMQNNSSVLGMTNWFQGDSTQFGSYNGTGNSYIAADKNNASGANDISNWLVTPNITIRNGDVITFYTRKISQDTLADRLQLRMSRNGSSTNVGALGNAADVGDFTTLLIDINPALITGVYPLVWTQYTATISGLPAPVSGRFAFRYFVTNGGPAGTSSEYIGIDNFVYTSVCQPILITPASIADANVGAPFSQTLSETGAFGAANYTVSGGALPPGLTLSVTGILSGTPTNTGAYAFDVKVTDANVCTGIQSYSMNIVCASTSSTLSSTATPSVICMGQSSNLNAVISPYVQSGFSGFYAPSLWNLYNGAGGNVNSTAAPASISITSGDNSSDGYTVFKRGVLSSSLSSTITFDWNYSTGDGPNFDYPHYVINGVATLLPGYSTSGSNNQSGTATITIPAGQTFALDMYTVDGMFGAATTVFSNFTGTDASGTINWFTVSSGGTSIGTSAAGIDFPIIPTSAGINDYYAEETNIYGCAIPTRSHVTVSVNALPTVTASASSNVLCAGDSLTLTGGGALTYTWNNSVSNGVTFAPAAGTINYIVTGTDTNSCINTASASVLVNSLPTVTANASAHTICAGDSITLTGNGASSYIWDNSVTDGVRFSPAAGTVTYYVTGTDSNGCKSSASATVTVNPVNSIVNYPVICAGTSITVGTHRYNTTGDYTDVLQSHAGCDSTIITHLTVSAPIASSSTLIICAGTSITIGTHVHSTSGNYTDVLTSTSGCDSTVTTHLTVSAPLTGNQTVAICSGDSIIVGTHTYISDGYYTDIFIGSTGCDSTYTTHLTVNPLPAIDVASLHPSTICLGQISNLNASIAPYVQIGFAGNYAPSFWTVTAGPGGNVNTSNAPSDIYMSSGDNGSSAATYFSRGILSAASNITITFDWSYSTPDGPGMDYPEYVLNGVATLLPGYNMAGTNSQNGTASITVPAGQTFALEMYTVDGVFGAATTAFSNFTGTDPSGTINWYTVPSGGTSTGTSSPGVDFPVTPAASGNFSYFAEVTNVFGCVNSARNQITVTVNPLPTVTAIASANTLCAGDYLRLTSTGSATKVWDNNVTEGVQFIPAVGTMTYEVTGTDGNGCVNTSSTTVTVNTLPVVTANPTATNLCIGDSLTLNGGGALSYIWINNHTNGVAFLPPVGTATYAVIGTDNNGCVNTASTMVSVHSLPVVTATASATPICAADSVRVFGGGAATYTWDNGVTDNVAFAPPVGTLTYHVIGTDSYGCTGNASTSITVNAQPVVNANASATNFCQGNTLTLTGSGTVSYVWDNNVTDGTAFTPAAGAITYNVTGTDAIGCTNTAAVTVTVNPVYTIDNYPTVCAGDSVIIGTSIYRTSGDYSDLFASVISGCDSTINTHLIVLAPIANSNTLTICAGDSIIVGIHTYNMTGNYTDVFVSYAGCDSTLTTNLTVSLPILASQTISICSGNTIQVGTNVYDTSGVYSDVLHSFSGCDSILTTNLTVVLPVHTFDTLSICSGDSVIVGTFVYHNSGTFTDILVSHIGCDSTVTLHLTVNPIPVLTVDSVGICTGQTATITATGAAAYIWSAGATPTGTGTAVASPGSTATYTVTGTTAGCTATATAKVTVNTMPVVTMAPFNPSSICAQSAPFTVPAGTPAGGTYSGLAVSGNTFTPSVTLLGTNFVTYSYTNQGCTGAASQSINVHDCAGVEHYSPANNVSIYPNPTAGQFTIAINNAEFDELLINITDMQGREVYNLIDKNTASDYTRQLNLEGVAKGIYFIKLSIGAEVKIQKLIIE